MKNIWKWIGISLNVAFLVFVALVFVTLGSKMGWPISIIIGILMFLLTSSLWWYISYKLRKRINLATNNKNLKTEANAQKFSLKKTLGIILGVLVFIVIALISSKRLFVWSDWVTSVIFGIVFILALICLVLILNALRKDNERK